MAWPIRVQAQDATQPGRLVFTLPAPASSPAKPDAPHNGGLPLYFEADSLEGSTGTQTRATGSVKVKQGEMTVRADELVHTQADNTARAMADRWDAAQCPPRWPGRHPHPELFEGAAA